MAVMRLERSLTTESKKGATKGKGWRRYMKAMSFWPVRKADQQFSTPFSPSYPTLKKTTTTKLLLSLLNEIIQWFVSLFYYYDYYYLWVHSAPFRYVLHQQVLFASIPKRRRCSVIVLEETKVTTLTKFHFSFFDSPIKTREREKNCNASTHYLRLRPSSKGASWRPLAINAVIIIRI